MKFRNSFAKLLRPAEPRRPRGYKGQRGRPDRVVEIREIVAARRAQHETIQLPAVPVDPAAGDGADEAYADELAVLVEELHAEKEAGQYAALTGDPAEHERLVAVLQERTVLVPIISHKELAAIETAAELTERFNFVYWEADLQFDNTLELFGVDPAERAVLLAMSTAGRESAVTGELTAVA